MEKLRAVGYIRVSDEDQLKGESPDVQKAKLIEYANDNNYELVKTFFDEGKSAKTVLKRDKMLEMIKFCVDKRNEISTIIFYKMDRASRDSPTYQADFRSIIRARGISVRSVTENIDDTPNGRFMENLLVGLAQLDNEVKGDRITDSMESIARQGWWQHGPVLGYDVLKVVIGKTSTGKDKTRSTLTPNENAPLVKQVLERFGEGDITKAELKKYAEKLGLRTSKGNKLNDEAIKRLLKKPVYAGYVCGELTNNELVEGKHDGLISKEVYRQNQLLLQKNTKAGKTTYLKDNEMYPLKGTLLCSACEEPAYASSPLTGGKKSHSARYQCFRASCSGQKQKSSQIDEVHNAFQSMLSDIVPTEGAMRLYKEILVRQAAKQNKGLNTKIRLLRNELSDLGDQRLKVIESKANAKNEREKDQFSELIDSYDIKKIDLKNDLSDLEKAQSLQESNVSYALDFMNNASVLWAQADLDIKQKFQRMIFPEGVAMDFSTQKFRTTKISPLYRYAPTKKDLSEAEKSLLVTPTGVEPVLPG